MAKRLSFCGKTFLEADITPADGGKSIVIPFENHPPHAVETAVEIIERNKGIPPMGQQFESCGKVFAFSKVVFDQNNQGFLHGYAGRIVLIDPV